MKISAGFSFILVRTAIFRRLEDENLWIRSQNNRFCIVNKYVSARHSIPLAVQDSQSWTLTLTILDAHFDYLGCYRRQDFHPLCIIHCLTAIYAKRKFTAYLTARMSAVIFTRVFRVKQRNVFLIFV